MDIRRLGPGDERLAVRTVRTLKQAQARIDEEAMRRFLARGENCLIVATVEDSPVGFLLAYFLDRVDTERIMAFFYEIEVLPDYRRRGIARAMIDRLRAICVKYGAAKLWVQTTRENTAAVSLYLATGAAEVEQGDTVTYAYPLESH